ncbi:MAG: aldehyde dehydrogenase family protein [Deltaproteobacteria bacterium]|nr:aldehyde dehydrogenase family protein [Deltaproteobacteria bacterium]
MTDANASASVFSTQNPATGASLSQVAAATEAEVRAAVAAARTAQRAWAARPFAERVTLMLDAVRLLLRERDAGIAVMSAETGRCATECLMSEVSAGMTFARAAIRAAKKALVTERISLSPIDFPGKKVAIEVVPRGVVGVIAPWNYPIGNFFKALMPALLAGNGVVMKPSEKTPRSGAWLAATMARVFPPGLVGIVQGDKAVGRWLLASGIDAVVFTGSVTAGKEIAAKAGELLIPCSVELGGKDAAIVLADCRLDRTVAGVAQWAFHNAGQNCGGIERIYVERPIADLFVDKLSKLAAALQVAPAAAITDLGPLQNAAQLAVVEAHVKDALAKGARLVAGGKRTGVGLGYQPTVLDGCTPDMLVMSEETFGPVVGVTRVADAAEAVALANRCRYGLSGSVWTRDVARGLALARALEVGVAAVNNHAFTGSLPEVPWTGVKDTGPGVANSHHAYHVFVRRRTVFVDRNKDPDPWWLPIDADLQAFGEALVRRALGSATALLTLARLLPRRLRTIRALAAGIGR